MFKKTVTTGMVAATLFMTLMMGGCGMPTDHTDTAAETTAQSSEAISEVETDASKEADTQPGAADTQASVEAATQEDNKTEESTTTAESAAGAVDSNKENAGDADTSSKDADTATEVASNTEGSNTKASNTEDSNIKGSTAGEVEGAEAQKPIEDMTGLEFTASMGIGWNLGNTFDGHDESKAADNTKTETAWQNDVTTPELIQAVHDAGFDTIRIPVSWHNHLMDDQDTIAPKFLDRIQEVVDYAYNDGMYVIINIHHDNDKEDNCLYPDKEHQKRSEEYVKHIWTQLSARFQDYDQHLIFEGMNEPRLVGHNNEWWIDPNNQDCKDAIEIISGLNQTFVDTVRASGGNNANRYLMCPGYCASPDGALNAGYKLPADTADNKLIVSAHAYFPYHFALEEGGTAQFDSKKTSDTSDISTFIAKLYQKYVMTGTPVVIGEYGAMDRGGNTRARADYAGYYVKVALKHNMPCIWWDNNNLTGSGETFTLFNRKTCEPFAPEIVEAMMASKKFIQN